MSAGSSGEEVETGPRERSGHPFVSGQVAAEFETLAEGARDKQLSRTIARYGRVGIILLEEVGYISLDRRGAELLFEVPTEREEKASVGLASAAAFSAWTKTFTDRRRYAAIVDRLTDASHVIENRHDQLATRPPPSELLRCSSAQR
jgi:DNA replication protein DnaC